LETFGWLKFDTVSSIGQCNTISINMKGVLHGKDGKTWAFG
jgi:hypothetical protein